MKNTPHLALASIPFLAAASLAHAFTAAENFGSYTAGTNFGTSALTSAAGAGDAGTGAAGNGWLNGWRSASSLTAPTVNIVNTSPLSGGGNYLAATLTANTTTTLDSIAVGRAYDVTGGGLASAGTFLVNFDFRSDAIDGSTMKFDLFESSFRATASTNTGASYSFRTENGVWKYFNGAALVSTGLAFTSGTTYSFNISINPATFTYSFTISNGSTPVSISNAAFRAANFNTDATAGSAGGRWVEFSAAEISDVAGQAASFSVDNISVSTIPEPASAALLLGLGGLGLSAMRRRRR